MAWALSLQLKKSPGAVYVVMGDGELAEGNFGKRPCFGALQVGFPSPRSVNRNRSGHGADRRFSTFRILRQVAAFGWNVLTWTGTMWGDPRCSG